MKEESTEVQQVSREQRLYEQLVKMGITAENIYEGGCKVRFDAGGDSMNEIDLVVETGGDEIDVSLWDYEDLKETNPDVYVLCDLVYNMLFDKVSFYEVSDGHYQGEHGYVHIYPDDDEKEVYFTKEATQEFEEDISLVRLVELTENEIDFLKNFVRSIDENWGWGDFNIVYKDDFAMTEEREEILKSIQTKVIACFDGIDIKSSEEYREKWRNGDYHECGDETSSEGYNIPHEDGRDEMEFIGNALKVRFHKGYYFYYEYEE